MNTFYDELVAEHSPALLRYAFRFCGNAHSAEDLVAEACAEAWKNLPSLRDPRSAKAWLYKIQHYRCLNWLRCKKRHPQASINSELLEATLASSAASPLEVMERYETVWSALNSLDEIYRDCFLLIALEGLTFREAADRLRLPLGTVLSRNHRARNQLRVRLEEGKSCSSQHLRRAS